MKLLQQVKMSLDKGPISPVFSQLSVSLSKVNMFWAQLTVAQKLYLLAIVILMAFEALGWVAMITVVAMVLEFWPLFERVWHSLAGKAVLLLFYAIIANFALGWSSSIVNEVVGVSASHLDYTHNLAILLYMPAWFVMVSAIVLMMVQAVIPFYFPLLFILKPLGIKSLKLTHLEHFRKTTIIVRMILSCILLYHLAMLIGVQHIEALSDDFPAQQQEGSETTNRQQLMLEATADLPVPKQAENMIKQAVEKAQLQQSVDSESNLDAEVVAPQEEDIEETYAKVRNQYQQLAREMIALFAFRFEANGRSRCKKLPESNVIELNDYEILEIIPDEVGEYGYRFEVKKCISPAFPETVNP